MAYSANEAYKKAKSLKSDLTGDFFDCDKYFVFTRKKPATKPAQGRAYFNPFIIIDKNTGKAVPMSYPQINQLTKSGTRRNVNGLE